MCLYMLIYTQEVILINSKHITNYKPKNFSELLGVSVKTLQRWNRENILKAKRTPTDRRYYTYDQYLEFKGINSSDSDRKTVIYTRVSTNGQKYDLINQIEFLLNFTSSKGIIVDETINLNEQKGIILMGYINKTEDINFKVLIETDQKYVYTYNY